MSNKYFFGMAVAALALSSCTQDEMVSMQKDAISYSVFAKNQTRAENSYCAINLPEGFKVYARTTNTAAEDEASNSKLYINGDDIMKNGSNWIDQSGTRYWPESGSLDFVAHVNGGDNFKFNLSGQSTFYNFVVNEDVTKQLDLMYAVNSGVVKTSSAVYLNFRHALSQVCFKANNKTSNLRITIYSVTVGNLNGEGTYTLPTANTDINLPINHNTGEIVFTQAGDINRGEWVFSDNTNLKSYTANVNGNSVMMEPESGLADLTSNTQGHSHKEGWTNVMMLMPQSGRAAWNPSNNRLDGTYFKLNIKMENKTFNAENEEVYTDVFGGNGEGYIYIPVTIDWKEGVRYTYTFNFNDGGSGGYVDPTNPKPAIVAIDLRASFDDFLAESEDASELTMKKIARVYFVKDGENSYEHVATATTAPKDITTVIQEDGTILFKNYPKWGKYTVDGVTSDGGNQGLDIFNLQSDWTAYKVPSDGNVTFPHGETLSINGAAYYIPIYLIYKTSIRYDKPDDVTEWPEELNVSQTETFDYIPKNQQNQPVFTVTLSDKSPVKDGFEFKGWSIKENPEPGDKFYNLGDEFQFEINERNVILYPQWQGVLTLIP